MISQTLNLSLTNEHFKVLITKGYSLDLVFLLHSINETSDISLLLTNKKIELLHQTLLRKALITEDNKITKEGKSILDFLSSPIDASVTIEKRKIAEDDVFNKWWNAYPGTDTFMHKQKSFVGSRALKVKKDECRMVITKILGEGEYTIDELVKALEIEVNQKKDNSVKTGSNKLSYMQNSLTYLNQRTFEPFIELVKQSPIKEEQTGGTDI
jgi:hypothetical protein